MIQPPGEPAPPVRTWFANDPVDTITLGALFSEHASGGYVDSITGIWASPARDSFFFFDSRYDFEDNDQFVESNGLAFRQRIPDYEIILGVNAFWDAISSAQDNDFNQLGVGAEVLTRWVDARFNYYLPEDDIYETSRRTERHTSRSISSSPSGIRITERTHTRNFKRFEAALEGFDSEIGFLIPGLDRYAEVRIFGGYYHFDNPFGKDFEGFKGRLEARLLPGLIADLEYWNDTALMGGHWTAGARVTLPFSLFDLAKGRNPFAGAGEFFRPRQRDFQERMGEMIIRSPRIRTVESDDILTSSRTKTKTTTIPVIAPAAPTPLPVRRPTPPPPPE